MQKNQVFENFQLQEEFTEFNHKTFQNTNFSKCDLNSYEFIDCIFISCDFSLSCFNNLVLTRVKFIDCKLLGVDFSKCSKYVFSVCFDKCILNYCFFFKNNLKKTLFKQCFIKEACFSETELQAANFIECDLSGTLFEKCNLTECDFKTSINYSIVPSENIIKKAVFSYPGVIGLLNQYNIIIEE